MYTNRPPIRILVFGLAELVHTETFVRLALGAGLDVLLAASDDPIRDPPPNYRFVKYEPHHWRGRRFKVVRAIETIANVLKVRHLCRQIRPDVVNVQWVDERAYYCALAGGFPLVLSCYGSDINRFFTGAWTMPGQRNMTAYALASAELVTADCAIVLNRVEQLAKNRVRTHRFFYGIDSGAFDADHTAAASELKRKLQIPETAKVILSCRRLAPEMGQEHILEAFAKLVRMRHHPPLALVLKRHEGKFPVEDNLRQTAIDLGVHDSVFWIDPAPHRDVPIHYAMADLVVNYPAVDAVPVSFFEAGAARKPVVSSDVPAYREMFSGALLLVPPGDSDALCAKLSSALLESEGTRASRIERNLAIAREFGDRGKNGVLISRLFHELAHVPADGRRGVALFGSGRTGK